MNECPVSYSQWNGSEHNLGEPSLNGRAIYVKAVCSTPGFLSGVATYFVSLLDIDSICGIAGIG